MSAITDIICFNHLSLLKLLIASSQRVVDCGSETQLQVAENVYKD